MKDSMPPEPPVPPQISGPPHGGGYGGPGHHQQQHMPPHSMPAPPPPPSINQHHLHHQASRDMSDHGHDSYHQHHDNYEDEGGMANMDLEEPDESSYHGNHKPMPDVYHTARRHPNSPQWDFFANFTFTSFLVRLAFSLLKPHSCNSFFLSFFFSKIPKP